MSTQVKTVAVIGGGPAGASLGTLLAKKGYKVGLFHTPKRPALIVGESLLPAVIPMLRELGAEDEVKSFSVYKPGATICLKVDEIITAPFAWADGKLPNYAYNTPRDLFDQAVLNAAQRAGAKVFKAAAKLHKGDGPGTVGLSADTLDATGGFFPGQPDLIVDASGRVRTIARLLDIPSKRGGREDVAIFAHLDKAMMADPGNIHVDYLTKGWSWRIPLPGKTSVGVVIQPKHLEMYGDDIEQQYDSYIRQEPSLKVYTEGAKRLTPVVKYSNYQLISDNMYGPGWATIGDAAGFIDPVFSTGVFLGMKSAFELFKAIEARSDEAMRKYQAGRHRDLKLWQIVIDSWYSGRLFNLYRAGKMHKKNPLATKIEGRVTRRLVRIFTGQAADVFNMKVFEHLLSLGAWLRDPKDLEIA